VCAPNDIYFLDECYVSHLNRNTTLSFLWAFHCRRLLCYLAPVASTHWRHQPLADILSPIVVVGNVNMFAAYRVIDERVTICQSTAANFQHDTKYPSSAVKRYCFSGPAASCAALDALDVCSWMECRLQDKHSIIGPCERTNVAIGHDEIHVVYRTASLRNKCIPNPPAFIKVNSLPRHMLLTICHKICRGSELT
jgi:hypothetical protein